MSIIRLLLVIVALSTLSACSTTPYSKEVHAASVAAYKAQLALASQQVAENAVNVIYTGFALSSESNAFQGDILAGKKIVSGMSKTSVQLLFSNKQAIDKAKLPFATEDDIELGIFGTVQLAEEAMALRKKQALVVILLTSHGNDGFLAVNADGRNRALYSNKIAKLLEPLESIPTLLIISACRSGSLIPYLKNDNRIIMTASSAERNSFGCRPADNRTWYVDSLAKAFDPKQTLEQWHASTVQLIEDKEKKSSNLASQPQLWIGKNMSVLAATELGRIAEFTPVASAAGANLSIPIHLRP